MSPSPASLVKELISEHLSKKITSENLLLVDDLGADDLDLIEIVMSLEEKFNIEISDDAHDKIFSNGSIHDIIQLVKFYIEERDDDKFSSGDE
jgi:acyl carrier protein